jgi:hypothetical protein
VLARYGLLSLVHLQTEQIDRRLHQAHIAASTTRATIPPTPNPNPKLFRPGRLNTMTGDAAAGSERCLVGIHEFVSPSPVMMMMILHQMRHGRQVNHATNHVRCTKTRKEGQNCNTLAQLDFFVDVEHTNVPKPFRTPEHPLLARAVPVPCFHSAFLTTAAHGASCLRWLQVYKQQRT